MHIFQANCSQDSPGKPFLNREGLSYTGLSTEVGDLHLDGFDAKRKVISPEEIGILHSQRVLHSDTYPEQDNMAH